MCRKKRMVGQKDREKTVVGRICRRGALSSPNYGVLVVRALGSCLGDNGYVGRIDGNYPNRIC